MQLEGLVSGPVIHNRRFGRRQGKYGHYSHPNPETRHAQSRHTHDDAVRNLPALPFATGLPVSGAFPNALGDVGFLAECAEGILNGLSQAFIGLDADGTVKTCNGAASTLLKMRNDALIGRPAAEAFGGDNAWLADCIAKVQLSANAIKNRKGALATGNDRQPIRVTVFPLTVPGRGVPIGTMVLFDKTEKRSDLSEAMAHYMNPDLIERLSANDEAAWVAKDTLATILFADLRGFTSITEEIGARSTVRLLNKFFTLMVDCIAAESGAVDKFAGDSLMAGFGITRHAGDEEDRSVRAGIAMLKALEGWNASRRLLGRRPMQMGIGIATDLVISGNVGSPKRMDYTLIGDGVNLAARLESACKLYRTDFLIAESTYSRLKGHYKIREIDQVMVVGRTKPVRIFEVLDHRATATTQQAIDLFHDARRHYNAGHWEDAIATFRDVLALDPEDTVSRIYIQRCERLTKERPAEWTGIWALESK